MQYEIGDKIIMKENYHSLPNDNHVGYFGSGYAGQVATIIRMFPKRANGYQSFQARFDDKSEWNIDPIWCEPYTENPEELESMLIKGKISFDTFNRLREGDKK